MKTTTLSNIINEVSYKKSAVTVLSDLYNALNKSYGPYGSTTLIAKDGVVEPTKDGDTILSAIFYKGPLERSIKDLIQTIVDNVIKAVGDGTTTSVLISKLLYDRINTVIIDPNGVITKNSVRPKDVVDTLKRLADEVSEEINKSANKVETLDDILNLAAISLNNDKKAAQDIVDAYKEVGFDAQVNIEMAKGEETYFKHYKGYTLPYGYMDPTLINNDRGECELNNANVIIFDDAIKSYKWEQFLHDLLLHFYNNRPNENFLIVAPQYSVTAMKLIRSFFAKTSESRTSISVMQIPTGSSSAWDKYMDVIVSTGANAVLISQDELPVIASGNIHERDEITGEYVYNEMDDRGNITGTVKMPYVMNEANIKKFENGMMYHTPAIKAVKSNLDSYFGKVSLTQTNKDTTFILNEVAEDRKTKFDERKETIRYQISKLENARDRSAAKLFGMKNRLSILEGKLVTIFIGGITEEDRKEKKALYIDASLSVASAIRNGYVYGASKAGMNATAKVIDRYTNSGKELEVEILNCIHESYVNVYTQIFTNANIHELDKDIINNELPYNVITRDYDKDIISSALTDVMILKSATDIIGKILLSNQFLLPTVDFAGYYEN